MKFLGLFISLLAGWQFLGYSQGVDKGPDPPFLQLKIHLYQIPHQMEATEALQELLSRGEGCRDPYCLSKLKKSFFTYFDGFYEYSNLQLFKEESQAMLTGLSIEQETMLEMALQNILAAQTLMEIDPFYVMKNEVHSIVMNSQREKFQYKGGDPLKIKKTMNFFETETGLTLSFQWRQDTSEMKLTFTLIQLDHTVEMPVEDRVTLSPVLDLREHSHAVSFVVQNLDPATQIPFPFVEYLIFIKCIMQNK